jgi:hypothetical protein
MNEEEIKYIIKRPFHLSTEDINLKCISCQSMFNSVNDKYLVCFINGSQDNAYFLTALAFDPEKNFEFGFMPESPLIYDTISYAKVIKSCINDEQTKALVCYSLDIMNLMLNVFIIIHNKINYQKFLLISIIAIQTFMDLISFFSNNPMNIFFPVLMILMRNFH